MSRQEPEVIALTPIVLWTAQFVDRQREIALVRHEYEIARSGCVRVVVLAGEPGVGKTRLLEEIARFVESDGAIVLRGDASDTEGMPPFLPFLEVLGQHIRMTPSDLLREQIAVAPQALMSMLPELEGRIGEAPAPYPFVEQGRLRLFEAVTTFLDVISKSRMLVLMLDDLHWADAASFDLLCYITRQLARQQSKARILILGTYREGEMSRHPPLERAITELTRQRVLTTVTVSPLSAKETEALATSYLRGPISANVSALLYRQSEGNPFFAEEILRVWVESGALVQREKRWVAGAPLEAVLPQSILGALRQRFARLSTACIDHLRVASIIGRTFNLQLLATVEGKEAEAVEEHLLEAVRAGLIRSDGEGGFSFSHEKIREALYVEVSTSRRRRLHVVIGGILETLYEQNDLASRYLLTELAYHFARSGDVQRGAIYSHQAAEQAMRSSALEEAIFHYQVALDLLPPDDERRVSLLSGLGEAALQAGKEQKAAESFAEMQERLTRAGKPRSARAAHGMGVALWRLGELQKARSALEQALELLDGATAEEIVPVLVDLATVQTFMPEQQEARQRNARRALDVARPHGGRLEAMATRAVHGTLAHTGGEIASGVQAMKQALEPFLIMADSLEVAKCSFSLSIGHYLIAQVKYASQFSQRRIALMESHQQPCEQRGMYAWQALLAASLGAWSEAERAVEREHALGERCSNIVASAFLHQVRGFLAYQREHYAGVVREFQAAGEELYLSWVMGDLCALAQAALGKYEEAKASLGHMEAQLARLPVGTLASAPLLVCQALTAIAMGEQERARRLYPLLLPFRGQHYWFLVDRVLGMLATLRCAWDAAMKHLDEAEAIARREGLRPELARTYLARAELNCAQNRQASSAAAKTDLKRALALFDELGMANSVERAREQLRALSGRTVRQAARTFPADLTERETRVLQLVAQGQSNRQIAHTLGLSEKTVANHLSHIFSKIGSENRASATAFAIRHGLA